MNLIDFIIFCFVSVLISLNYEKWLKSKDPFRISTVVFYSLILFAHVLNIVIDAFTP